jgi:hypothetical protein
MPVPLRVRSRANGRKIRVIIMPRPAGYGAGVPGDACFSIAISTKTLLAECGPSTRPPRPARPRANDPQEQHNLPHKFRARDIPGTSELRGQPIEDFKFRAMLMSRNTSLRGIWSVTCRSVSPQYWQRYLNIQPSRVQRAYYSIYATFHYTFSRLAQLSWLLPQSAERTMRIQENFSVSRCSPRKQFVKAA